MAIDLVSDMLTRIRNATLVLHKKTLISYSNLNLEIAKLLFKEGYISGYTVKISSNSKKEILIVLKYKGWWIKKPYFTSIIRVSKPGKRLFSGYKEFYKKIDVLKHKQGMAIISTSSGIMSHTKAIHFKKGGEILSFIG
jgi:small subunit ribosomal protein S8